MLCYMRQHLAGVNRGQYFRRVAQGWRLPRSFVGLLARIFVFRISLKLLLCSIWPLLTPEPAGDIRDPRRLGFAPDLRSSGLGAKGILRARMSTLLCATFEDVLRRMAENCDLGLSWSGTRGRPERSDGPVRGRARILRRVVQYTIV